MEPTNKHGHYYKDVSKLQVIDVYRVLQLFNVNDPCIQHAVKKLLVAGGRGAGKDITKDISEAIDSLERWEEMDRENTAPLATTLTVTNSTLPLAPKNPVPPPKSELQKSFSSACSNTVLGSFPALQQAHNRIYDLLMGDDGQAVKEAERYLQLNDPVLWAQLQAYYFRTEK